MAASWPGIVAAIHVFLTRQLQRALMPGTRPGITDSAKDARSIGCELL
jgi:hypothetical protein